MKSAQTPTRKIEGVVPAFGEMPIFAVGQRVKVSDRAPVGHYRVPTYLRGKTAVVEAIMEPKAVNNEEEAFGRNAGGVRHYYRIAVPMTSIWSDYAGSPGDGLRIEVFETWLEGASE
ncbi:nitrile hydratase subunit beta [Rhizobium ruizarguesonis]|uniref:SH3-like domain-containing protein n=1 Tax=Rhizobium ruizarguesonis TaxID=2081791 RepID=UPI00102F4FD3|nr:SH3-like domain-containing protein [Rhizobium ruizarguesonis]TAV98378.1 nitrile hydratase subunit beta [Rhizobium ruizarguesonis]